MNRIKLGPLAGLSGSIDSESGKEDKQQSPDYLADPFSSPPELSQFNALPGEPFKPGCQDINGGEPEADSWDSLHYSCFLPVHYQSNHAYPLVVWLHSKGSDHRQLDNVMPLISERNYVGVSLNGRPAGSGLERSFGWLQTSESIELAINQLSQVIESACQRFNINKDRIFVAGRGAGGTMAFRVAFERPEWFAGIISLNGSLPSTLSPLSNWRSCRGLPVFWGHGRHSVAFPESNLCHQLRLLHVAGFDVTLRQYPGDDQLPVQVYGDANVWMMEQIAAQGASIIG